MREIDAKTLNRTFGKVIFCGGEELGEYEWERLRNGTPLGKRIVWLAYWYESGCYEGSGKAVYLDSLGTWHQDDLGHCSCYGPFDGGFNDLPYTLEQVIETQGKAWAREEHSAYQQGLIKALKRKLKQQQSKGGKK